MMKRLLILALFCLTASAHAALNIQTWMLPNGAKVLYVENRGIPIIDINVDLDAGDRRSPMSKTGLASLTNAMLARGIREARLEADAPGGTSQAAPAMSEAQISDAFADTAAQRGGGSGQDRASVSLRTLSSEKERKASVALVARLLAHPAFPEELLARDKARTIAAIREELTRPESIASKAFWRTAYGNHPYGQEPTVESIQSITREDLLLFHRTHYVANRAVVSIIGDVSRQEADAIAKELTQLLPQGAALPALPKIADTTGAETRIPHPASQAHIMIGTPALVRNDPDFFPLTVGNYVLGGGGFVSRLMHEVREKRGLSYSVYSYFSPLAQEGPFQVGLQTQKEQADAALKVVRETVAGFLRNGPTEAELQAAKDNLTGGFALRLDSNRKILDHVAMIGFYDMPLDYLDRWTERVAKVTREEVITAFQSKLDPNRLATVIVGADPVTK